MNHMKAMKPAMWVHLLMGLLWWLLPPLSFGQTLPASPATSCLWKVESPHTTLYLLGSIHALTQEEIPLNPVIQQAFQEVDSVVLEIDPGAASQPFAQAHMLQTGLLPKPLTLHTQLSPASYTLVKSHLTQRGLPIEPFQRFKPWFLALTLAALDLQTLGFSPEYGIDQVLWKQAQAEGKSIQSFETMEFQLSLFDTMSPATQEQFIIHTLDDMEVMKRDTQLLIAAWRQGRIRDLQARLAAMKAFPELYDTLLVQRNHNWLPKIENLLKQKNRVMIIVGVLHLLGEEGLLNLLKEKGYVVQQL